MTTKNDKARGQCLVVSINGFPFQLQKMRIANEMRDSLGDVHRLQFLKCNFTESSVEILAFTDRQENRERHFRTAVTVYKEGMVIMKTGSVE